MKQSAQIKLCHAINYKKENQSWKDNAFKKLYTEYDCY